MAEGARPRPGGQRVGNPVLEGLKKERAKSGFKIWNKWVEQNNGYVSDI